LPNASTEFHGKGKLTAEQVRLIGDPDMLFRAIGRIDYEDDRNKDYTTTFCYVRRTDGILTTCDELNDMK